MALLGWTLAFGVAALFSALLGFSGLAGTFATFATVLFVVFLVLFVLSLLLGAAGWKR